MTPKIVMFTIDIGEAPKGGKAKFEGNQLRLPLPTLYISALLTGLLEKEKTPREKWIGLSHLGVVDNKGMSESILKRTSISCHTTANGTGQVPLAEQVTWVQKETHTSENQDFDCKSHLPLRNPSKRRSLMATLSF